MCPERQGGFVLPTAIFLLVVMASLAAVMVRLTGVSQVASSLDVQGARAVQAARLGIEAGVYAVQRNGNCPGGAINNIPGLTGFTVVWSCTSQTAFSEDGNITTKNIWQITSTACSPVGAACPSVSGTEQQNNDYVERQLVVVTER